MEGCLSNSPMECYNLIFAGFGFREHVDLECFLEVLSFLYKKHKNEGELVAISTLAKKARYPVFQMLAKETNLQVISLDIRDIIRQNTLSFSELSMQLYQTGSLAEASALAAAGKNSQLLSCRIKSTKRMATCALAKGVTE